MNAPCYPLLLVAALAVTPLLAIGRDAPTSNSRAPDWVCVVNKVSKAPGPTCTYSAVLCKDGSPMTLESSDCDLTAGKCDNAKEDPNCFDVLPTVIEESSGHVVVGDRATNGLPELPADGFQLTLYNNAKIVLSELVQLDTAVKKLKVRLFLIRTFDNKQKFYQVVGQGIEVKSDKAPDFVVEKDSPLVRFKGKFGYLNLRGARYTFILNTKVGTNNPMEEEPPLLEAEFRLRNALQLQARPAKLAPMRSGAQNLRAGAEQSPTSVTAESK